MEDILRDVEYITREMAKVPKTKPLLGFLEEAVLHLLGKSEVLSIKELREILQINSDNLSHVLRSLEHYSKREKVVPLVKRDIDPSDIRCKRVSITKYGKKLLSDNSKRRKQRLGILISRFNKNDLDTFSALLKKMIEGINEKRQQL